MGKVGVIKICPLMSDEFSETQVHCLDDCEWNDGEGCAIWRIVKALEQLVFRSVQIAATLEER